MSAALTEGTIQSEWTMIPVNQIIVKDRLRKLDEDHVKRLMESFTTLGFQIHPVTVDEYHTLIAGAHRLEAMRRLNTQGEPGWHEIGALVVSGATEHDQRWIELEENQARKQMSPVEIQKLWESYGEPVFKAKAKQRRDTAGVTVMNGSAETNPDATVTSNSGNSVQGESVSLPAAARLMTGQSLDWLNKVADIRSIAESENAPKELREAALRGIAKLSRPDAPVEPVYKSLLKIDQAIREQHDPEAARARELEAHLDKLVKESTLLEERLDKGLAVELQEAAKVIPMGAEWLRAVRVALTKSLASIVVTECQLTSDASTTLNMIGGEVTRLLSERSISLLGLETDRG